MQYKLSYNEHQTSIARRAPTHRLIPTLELLERISGALITTCLELLRRHEEMDMRDIGSSKQQQHEKRDCI